MTRLLVYGGTFNPPHLGHLAAARHAFEQLHPDRLLLVPAADPPHKALAPGSPDARERLYLTELAARELPGAQVCPLELQRSGPSYTVDTIRQLLRDNPGAQILLLIGQDMLESFGQWHEAQVLSRLVVLVAAARQPGQQAALAAAAARVRQAYGAQVVLLDGPPLPADSTHIRLALAQRGGRAFLPPAVYERIISRRLYGAKPDLLWLYGQAKPLLAPSRLAHVRGCRQMAARLARRWGADWRQASEAAILHDITKKLSLTEQLILCKKYGIMNDMAEAGSGNLLHAKTGAALARERFGVDDAVYDAIRWHTTGRAGMTLLEKIIYLADCMEPTRTYPHVAELRRLAFSDIDGAMVLALQLGLESLSRRGVEPHVRSTEALAWFLKGTGIDKK